MPIALAFLIAALVVFIVDVVMTRRLASAGLACLTAAMIAGSAVIG